MGLSKGFVLSVFTILSSASVGHAAQIQCAGADDGHQAVTIRFAEFDRHGVGVLTAETRRGIRVISNIASLATVRSNRLNFKPSRYQGDLYIDGAQVDLTLVKTGRQSYDGHFCGPQQNTVIAGVQFKQSECLVLKCYAEGLSKLSP